MNLLRALLFSTIVVILGLLAGFVTDKIYAVYLGDVWV